MAERKILVGVFVGAHGVRGDVRVRSFTEKPETIFSFKGLTDEGGRAVVLKKKGVVKDQFIASLKGVVGRDEAEALKGTKLFVERAALPLAGKRTYYEADLVGLETRGEGGRVYGSVIALHDYGAGAFLEIQPKKGASFMLPFNDAFVGQVDVKGGVVEVVVPEGWIGK